MSLSIFFLIILIITKLRHLYNILVAEQLRYKKRLSAITAAKLTIQDSIFISILRPNSRRRWHCFNFAWCHGFYGGFFFLAGNFEKFKEEYWAIK